MRSQSFILPAQETQVSGSTPGLLPVLYLSTSTYSSTQAVNTSNELTDQFVQIRYTNLKFTVFFSNQIGLAGLSVEPRGSELKHSPKPRTDSFFYTSTISPVVSFHLSPLPFFPLSHNRLSSSPPRSSFHAVYSLLLLPLLHKASRKPARWTRSLSPPIVGSSIFTAAGIVDAIDAISPSPGIALVATLIFKLLVWADCALLAELNVSPDVETTTDTMAPHAANIHVPGSAGPCNRRPNKPSSKPGWTGMPGIPGTFSHNVVVQQLSIDPTPLVIILFLFFFVTFFGLTLLATSKHMHHAHKQGVLYAVGSITRKWLNRAKALEQSTARCSGFTRGARTCWTTRAVRGRINDNPDYDNRPCVKRTPAFPNPSSRQQTTSKQLDDPAGQQGPDH
ncbi:hypothetical protein QR685DRAFT_577750 [Neurospora intermedia]|uniref:Uncharacterized protein n=1 Tax=Neurospora intermedia TaxID=5142 RepID=A0ABR3DRV6_NEUIN